MAASTKSAGFTLIELVIVLVLLGILGAVALPRFLSLSSDAHAGVYRGAFAGFRSGVQLYHNGWLAHGARGAVINLASFDDGTVDSNAQGYPAGTSYDGTLSGANCGELWQALIDSDLATRPASNGSFDGDTSRPIKYWYRTGPDACYYIYVGERNDPGVDLPTLTYTLATGETSVTMSRYSNG
ncbi:prepilin-type N-terminal cleavage/methylation domain-containing protein [Ferrimonas sediminicola]|uniref:Prepilin-type N-terminal cleavage/methylation domain-containing protein n=1 Tax=Ferrimonas sediminicola TaxID=2569538 RepID=A0A4U1BGY0_9GAMM|nr:prepilin-type N-terminal cleavage/methylation domain-containing protein [Ferrimonas sediminicola]TKB50471.1 prepilin-type N-terminal cleavage/methylation domain-containing protein [Ferrimonas sediminicola]